MKKICKIISIFITGWFIAMTIPANNIAENAKAEEIEVDEEFIDWTLARLTGVASDEYWMGREYGTVGEQEAEWILRDLWNNNISNIEDPKFLDAVRERIDKGFWWDGIDEKIGISYENYEDCYSLYINEFDIKEEGSCFPITNGIRYNEKNIFGTDITYTVIETPDEWYGDVYEEKKDEELFTMELEEELKKENILYEIKCVLLNNCSGLFGEVAYFEDYESASINDTAGRIHLIDIDQDECDDVFMEKVNNVYNSNGTAFIAMVTNPSFINTLNTSVKGMVITCYDGEQIKQYLENNETVYIEMDEESSISDTEVILKVYHIPQCLTRYIYHIDMDKYTSRKFNPRSVGIAGRILEKSWNIKDDDDYPPASAFLYSDLSDNEMNGVNMNENSYLCSVECVYRKNLFTGEIPDLRTENPHIKIISLIPGFCITGKWGDYIQSNINNNILVKFSMKPKLEGDAESYNVIGEIDIDNPQSDEVVIICAHIDNFMAQGAIDDASGIAAMYGVAKYIKDHDITPAYDIKFIAFGGEEYWPARGSAQYVWSHIIPQAYGGEGEPEEDVIAVIELDIVGIDTKQIDPEKPPIPLNIWIHPRSNTLIYKLKYWYLLYDIINICKYKNKTKYSVYYPSFNDAYKKVKGGDLQAFDSYTDENTPLADWIISIERDIPNLYNETDPDRNVKYMRDNWAIRSFFDHRGGGKDFEYGDIISKIDNNKSYDYNDLYETTKMALNLVAHFAGFKVLLNFDDDCVYTQLDIDDDGQYDSVKVGYTVDSNITAGGQVESIIYQNGQPQTSNLTQYFTIGENETVYGNLTVTLPYNKSAGSCDIRVYLKNYEGDEEDFDNTTIYLYPYNDSIANFTWEVNDSNLKMVNFTDCSTPSPGATINSWNWSFGDGYYSTLQNCSHNYSSMGVFNVTLTVTDSANKSANITLQVFTNNTYPVALFNVSANLVLVNKTVAFNSTSYDIDGSIENATWYFGDNTSGYGINTTHSYNKSGYYMVSLFATDNDNATVKLTKTDHILVVDALVDDDFVDNPSNHSWDTIQEGINDASNNYIIYVYNGSYQSYLVNKSVSIYGEDKNAVEISSSGIGIDVQSHDIVIKNFTITAVSTGVNIISTVNGTGNVTIDNGVINGPMTYGVYIDNSSNNTIKNCIISDADAGIKICNGSMYNVIDNCEIDRCYNGVGIYSSSYNWVGNPSIYDWYPNNSRFELNTNAVYLDESCFNYILGCVIDATPSSPFSTTRGIYLDESSSTIISTCDIYEGSQGIYVKDSMNNKIEFCRIRDNLKGIELFGTDANDNLIVQNNITGNSQYGVYIPPDPSNNEIYYNDFINNVVDYPVANQSYDDRNSGYMNIWEKRGDNTLTKNGDGEGNYWDDYVGEDLDQDGIGDSPYEVDTTTLGVKDDEYPLMDSYNWCSDWD